MKLGNIFTIILWAGFPFRLSNWTDQSANTYSHSAMEEAKKAIAESNAVYFQAYVNNDSSVFIDRYAKDACIMAPNTPQVCGHGEVAKFFRFSYDQYGMRNGKFVTTAVYGDAVEYVTEEGLWQSFNANGELFDNGKFLVLWKKTAEGWKMYRDSFSSNNAQNN